MSLGVSRLATDLNICCQIITAGHCSIPVSLILLDAVRNLQLTPSSSWLQINLFLFSITVFCDLPYMRREFCCSGKSCAFINVEKG